MAKRKQPAALAKYWAHKRGGHPKTRTRTITKTKRVYVGAHKAKSHKRRGAKHGGMPRLLPLALTTLGLAYVTSDAGPSFVTTNLAKIPGAKTFGGTTMAGIACLAVDRFVKPNKWLKLAGIAGIVLGAAQVGKQGTNFKWVGDDDVGDYDLGDDDVGDDYIGEDDVGDDEG